MQTYFARFSNCWMRRGIIVTVVILTTFTTSLIFSLVPSPRQLLTAYAQIGQGYPTAADPYVNDYANVITPEDETRIRQQFSDLDLQQGVEAVVITINRMQDYNTGDSTIEAFGTHLFNTWGIGDVRKNNGVLLLVAVGDRKVRIEVGSGYGTTLDTAMKTVIDQTIVPRFQENDYSGGIRLGTDAIIQRVTASSGPLSEFSHKQGSWWLFGGSIGGLTAVGLGIRRYLRHRPHRCPTCRIEMVRLDEQADDQFLRQGQRLEEQLQSVDYDVWRCPSCSYQSINRYKNWFSGYSACKSCGFKAMSSRKRTIRAATYTSSGEAQVTETCKHCDYHNTYRVTVPRKQRSRSRSHGGGRSSGGGASGSW